MAPISHEAYKISIPISKSPHLSPESLHSPVALYPPSHCSQNIAEWSSSPLANIFNSLLYFSNSSSSFPLAIGINVPVGVTAHHCLVSADTGHAPRNTTEQPSTHHFMRVLRSIQFPYLGLRHFVFWGTPTRPSSI